MSFEDVVIPEGSTSLFVGAQNGNLALVRHALSTYPLADLAEYVNRRNQYPGEYPYGRTPLHAASTNHEPNEEAPIILRAGATLPQGVRRFSDPYLERIRELGSYSAYEKEHRKSFVALLAPKFPRLPVDALSHVVSFWAHVGDY